MELMSDDSECGMEEVSRPAQSRMANPGKAGSSRVARRLEQAAHTYNFTKCVDCIEY